MRFKNKTSCTASLAFIALLVFASTGCSLLPEVKHRPKLHNPFPQLKQVAVLPFYNQSDEPTVDGEAVALAYYAQLQAVPGFEVLPVGVARNLWMQYARTYGEPQSGEEFQRLAQFMGVEAVVVGSVTDFDAYYPPRMAMTVHWYASNPGFHPVPPGYGLPWGTKAEKRIPQRVVEEAEFELAREQLITQAPTPLVPAAAGDSLPPMNPSVAMAGDEYPSPTSPSISAETDPEVTGGQNLLASGIAMGAELPARWPDPTGLIPDPPSPAPPLFSPQSKPVLTHTRIYRGDDAYVTDKLADFVNNEDDARTSGWQTYLRRSNDFIRFCCHLHIEEMLESRGGRDQSDLILRWPISRY